MLSDAFLRMLDANLNRAKEGARVCEDVCRFILNDESLSLRWKHVRHQLRDAVQDYPLGSLIGSRDAESDVGKASTVSEFQRLDRADIFYANAQRVKEALRVMEEVLKLDRPEAAQCIKEIRYEVYTVEKVVAQRLQAVSDS